MFCKKYYLFLICLQFVACLRLHTNSRLSGFVLVDNNFTYVEELVPGQIDIAADPNSNGVPENRHDAYNPNERDVVSHAKANVRFEPSVLYFKDKVVGNSYRETVYIYNTSQNKTLRMEKIAGGKHSQIQIAAFGDELVAPGGNTTFDILFIGRDLVPLSTHYYIYTSKGILKYDVVSWCTENPYHISPMSEITLPLNSTYSHPITLRNPFPEPLQITEALLHGGTYASHTLPPGIDFENAVDSWTIQPYETKEILRVHFLTYEAWNLTTFQSIKLATGTTLLIPIEVEVTPRTGLYVLGYKLDFETGGHLDPPAVRPLHLCSSSRKAVTIESVSCEPRIDGCEVIDFRPTALPPWSCGTGPVAKVKFVWGANPPGEVTTGGLLIKNDLDPFFRVNYTARIYHGGLTYNSSLTHYVTGIPSFNSSPRPFAFTNEYRELLAVMNVYLSFEAAEYFHIRSFEPYVLKPQEKKVLFVLQTRKGVKLNELKLDSSILLETNISTIRLPLRVYDGLLTKLSKVAPSSLHVGLVSAKSTIITYFGVSNTNPETIFVKYFGCNDTSVRIELMDVKAGNAKTFYYRSFRNNESSIQHSGGFNIHPYHYASFKLAVNTSENEGEVYADVWLQSEYQKLVFPLYMNVAKGFIRVSPDPFVFEDCFPGAYCVQQLTVESHFLRSMSIMNISIIPYTSYDKLLFYPNMPALIVGHSTSIVGNILWEPTIDTSQTWPLGYLGLPNNRTGRDRWLGTIERPNITRDFDLTLMESQYLRYREQYSSTIDLTFRMDTTEMRNFLFKGRIKLQWPQIVTTRVIDFPLVQIGTISYENVSVFNPMHSHYMTVQAIMAQHYQQEVPTVVGTMISDYEEPGGAEAKSNEFFLDMGVTSPYRCNVLSGIKRKFTNHRSSIVFVLPPQANATIRIGFTPSSQVLTTTRLYLRNDFTILDSVAINGAGAYPQLALEGLESAAGNLIKFAIPHETLRLCEERNNRVLNITTKKVFRLRNTGQVSVHIFGFTINGLPCQGYGFKITNCHNTPFILKPGMSKRIEIAFTPDFTSARIESNLQVESDIKMGPMLSYTLYAALDSDWLRKCKPHLQRPYWEPLVYYLMIGVFFFLLIGVAIMAVYEVASYTNRLVDHFDEVGPKIQPFYDTKWIDVFFVRASVPHNHHHNHHHNHQRASTTTTTKLETVPSWHVRLPHMRGLRAIDQQNGLVANGHIKAFLYNADLDYRTSIPVVATTTLAETPSSSTAITTSSSTSTLSSPSASSAHSYSAELNSREQFIYNLRHIRTQNVTTAADDSDNQTAKNNSVTMVSSATTHNESHTTVANANDSPEDQTGGKVKRGKKYEFEDVCYKSNWFKKKQAKKEEKLNGKQFLKNGWTKCLKGGNLRKDANSCPERSTTNGGGEALTTIATSVADSSSTNVSSHSHNNNSNTKFSYKDNVPRKIELNHKLYSKKLNNNHATPAVAVAVAADSSTFEVISTTSETNSIDNKEINTKSSKQKRKKATEPTSKFHEASSKESVKENLAGKIKSDNCGSCGSPRKTKDEKQNAARARPTIERKSEEKTNSGDSSLEALKPITNLPKSKEPFETLSSLCSDSVSLKSKRKSNVKKRTKEDKFVNISKELSIVFTTPETIDHKKPLNKSSTKNVSNEKDQKKDATVNHQAARKSLVTSERRNDLVGSRDQHLKMMKGALNDVAHGLIPSTVDEETRILNMHRLRSTSNFLNGELYSRVVAPPTSRSSSSSSSSESSSSYESFKALPSKKHESQQSPSLFWDSWSNDMLFQGGVMPTRFNDSMFSENKNETPVPVSLNSDHLPTFVVSEESNYQVMGDNVYCSDGYYSKQDHEGNSDEDIELYKIAKASLSDDDEMSTAPAVVATTAATTTATANATMLKPVADIWGPPTSLYTWSPSDLSGLPSNLTSDTVSAISLSRLLRFEEKKEKDIEQQYRSLSSLWSTDMRSLWSHHSKQE